jgi:agmatinase
MDRKKLEKLRTRYAGDAPGQSHNPEFRKIVEKVFAGTDRRPKPYEGVATFLGALRAMPAAGGPRGLDVALVGVPWTSVTNRAGARLGPRAVRGVERIGPYHHVHRLAPLSEVKAADVGDVPFRSRFSLEDSHRDIEAFFARIAAAGVAPGREEEGRGGAVDDRGVCPGRAALAEADPARN